MQITQTIEKTIQDKMKKDDTILCYGKNLLSDCNDYVSSSSIALREVIIYSDIDLKIKEHIQAVLYNYGLLLDCNNDDAFDKICYHIGQLLGEHNATIIKKAYESDETLDSIETMIELLLIEYYQDYTIPTEKYDTIMYQNKIYNTCDKLKHHYKCLKNPSLDWNKYENNIELTLTYKDVKKIILESRDSGGHLDCFGYAHDGTTANCITAFVGNQLGIEYEFGCGFNGFIDIDKKQAEKLFNICEDIWSIVIAHMHEYLVELY